MNAPQSKWFRSKERCRRLLPPTVMHCFSPSAALTKVRAEADSPDSGPAALAVFDGWAHRFAHHVEAKQIVENAGDAARGTRSTTQQTELVERNQRFLQREEKYALVRYSKSASKDLKKAMERRKVGTLKSGRSGKTIKSKKAGDRNWAFGGSGKGEEVPRKKSA